jgi:hypothetical protein
MAGNKLDFPEIWIPLCGNILMASATRVLAP